MVPGDVGLPYPHPVLSITYNKSEPARFFFLIDCGHGRVLWQARMRLSLSSCSVVVVAVLVIVVVVVVVVVVVEW